MNDTHWHDIYYSLCLTGRLPVLKWLNTVNRASNSAYIALYFRIACERGHCDIAEWILAAFPDATYVILEDVNNLFLMVCYNHHIQVAQWLFANYISLPSSIMLIPVLRSACLHGQLELAKWIKNISPDLPPSILNTSLVYRACMDNRIDIAQWILRQNPAISIDDTYNSVFKCCHVNVARWLADVRKDAYAISSTGERIIYSMATRNWKRREVAFRLSTLRTSPHILNRLPADVSRYIITFI